MILLAGLPAFSQSNTAPCTPNPVIPCKTYTARIVADSIHNVRTVFQEANLYFLRSSCNDSVYVNSPLYNQPSFSSVNAQSQIDDFRKKRKSL